MTQPMTYGAGYPGTVGSGNLAAYAAYPQAGGSSLQAQCAADMESGRRGGQRIIYDPEAGGVGGAYNAEFLDEKTDIKIRHLFLRKVFTLLSICLGVSFGLCLAGNLIPPFRNWLLANGWFGAVGAVLMLVLSLVIICAPGASTKVPLNYCLLFAYALSVGMVFAGIGAYYSLKILTMAIGTTAAISFACMLFACQVKYDFTKWYPYLMVGLIAMFMMGIVGWFVRVEWFQILYSTLGVLLFSFMLVLDTQMIVGGRRKIKYSVDQYILATLTLFSDIVQIFLYVLRLFSMMED